MNQPRKILSAACLALALIFGADAKVLALNIDDSLSIEAALARCNANTELAALTIEGCYAGLRFVSADFPFRNRNFRDVTDCLDRMRNIDVHTLLDRQFARCDREWTHIYFRRGCKDAATAYYSSFDPVTFCTRGGTGVAPVLPLPSQATAQNRESELPFVLSVPLLPRMTPLFQKPRARSASTARKNNAAVCKPETAKAKPVAANKKTYAKAAAKPAEEPECEPTPDNAARNKKIPAKPTDANKNAAPAQDKKSVMTPTPPPAKAPATADAQPKPARTAPVEAAKAQQQPQSAAVDNSNFASATNVDLHMNQEQTQSVAVPFNPPASAASEQPDPILPPPPVIPLIPAGQLPDIPPQATQSATPMSEAAPAPAAELPPPNQFVYQNNSAQQATSLRDIPLGVPNQPVEGLAGAQPAGSLTSPALPLAGPTGPASPASPGGTPADSTPTGPVLPAPPQAPAPALPTLPVPPPPAGASTSGPQQPGTAVSPFMPGLSAPDAAPDATPGPAPQQQTPPPSLPGFFSSPDQTQTQIQSSASDPRESNPAQPLTSGPGAANGGQAITADNTGSSMYNQSINGGLPSGAPTSPPNPSVPFAQDPR